MQVFLKAKTGLVILILIGVFSAITDGHAGHDASATSARSAACADQACCVQCCPIHNLFPTIAKVSFASHLSPTLSRVVLPEVLFLESPYLSEINRPPIA